MRPTLQYPNTPCFPSFVSFGVGMAGAAGACVRGFDSRPSAAFAFAFAVIPEADLASGAFAVVSKIGLARLTFAGASGVETCIFFLFDGIFL